MSFSMESEKAETHAFEILLSPTFMRAQGHLELLVDSGDTRNCRGHGDLSPLQHIRGSRVGTI